MEKLITASEVDRPLECKARDSGKASTPEIEVCFADSFPHPVVVESPIMERLRRLATFWNWLPAFRVVAEMEHLPSAAEEFHVSASALSRSVRQLEDHLGVALFDRTAGSIVLNDEGREFLKVVRRAMRLLDDGVELVTRQALVGRIRMVAPGPFASLFLLPAISRLQADHPQLVPEILSMSNDEVNDALLAGKIDIGLIDDPLPATELTIEKLTDVSYGVYCGGGHPLFDADNPSEEAVLACAFAAPPEGLDDHWIPDRQRTVGLRLSQLHLGVEICAAGAFLAVLPDPVAAAYPKPLRRLPVTGLQPAGLYAVYREFLGVKNKTAHVLDALRETIAAQVPQQD